MPLRAGAAARTDLFHVDMLRAVACLAVVWHHALLVAQTRLYGMTIDLPVFQWFAGSAVFGVLTPVLMLMHGPKPGDDWRAYAVRRAIRLVPLYLGVTVITFAWLRISSHGVAPLEAFFSWERLAASLLLVATLGFEHPIVYPGWTLEFIIYLHVPVILALLHGDRVWRWTLAGMAALVAARLMMTASMATPPLMALTNGIMAPLAIGIATGLRVTGQRVTPDMLVSVAVAVAAMVARHLMHNESIAPVASALAAAVFVLVLAATPMRGLAGRTGLVIRALGRASYAIYICHALAISVCAAAMIRLDVWQSVDAFVAVEVAVAVVAGWLVHRCIEGHVVAFGKAVARRIGAKAA